MSMAVLNRQERAQLEAIARLAYCNPFLPDRRACEHAVLGPEFVDEEAVWSYRPNKPGPRAHVWRIYRRIEALAEDLRSRLLRADCPRDSDLQLYEDCVLHMLYTRHYQN